MSSYLAIHQFRYRYLLDLINRLGLPSGAKILDLGCYPPYLFRLLQRKGYKVFGVSSTHEKIAHPKVAILNLETDRLPYPANHFNLVVFSEVLEHLSTSPRLLFSQVYRVLKPGGFFLLTTPNAIRSQNLFNLILGRNIYFPLYQLAHHLNHRHHREYTMSELLDLIRNTKYVIRNTDFIISYPPFRSKNHSDPFSLKVVKYLNYFFMLLFPSRRDTIVLLLVKV